MSTLHPTDEDCSNSEAENTNLRAILAWVSATLRHAESVPTADGIMTRSEVADEIASRLRQPLVAQDGGVTVDSREEEREAVRDLMAAASALADHAEEVAGGGGRSGLLYEQCRTVRDKVQEIDGILPPTLHEARQKEKTK